MRTSWSREENLNQAKCLAAFCLLTARDYVLRLQWLHLPYKKNLLSARADLVLFPAGGASVHLLTTVTGEKEISLSSSVFDHSCGPGCFLRISLVRDFCSHEVHILAGLFSLSYWLHLHLHEHREQKVRSVSREGQNLFVSAVRI